VTSVTASNRRTLHTVDMQTLTLDLTVGELAVQVPASIRVFQKYRIDFCCGGETPLTEACRQHGLETTSVLREIENESQRSSDAGSDRDWAGASLQSLIDHIVGTHHVYVRTNLPRIQEMLDKVRANHSERHGDMLTRVNEVFSALSEELAAHLMKEERILFPLVAGMEEARRNGRQPAPSHCGSVANPIRVMCMEHDSAGEALARLRDLTADFTPPAEVCPTFRALFYELAELERDLHRHIHLENNILFPRAMALESAA